MKCGDAYWTDLQDICSILLGQVRNVEVVVLVQDVDGLLTPLQELAEAEVC